MKPLSVSGAVLGLCACLAASTTASATARPSVSVRPAAAAPMSIPRSATAAATAAVRPFANDSSWNTPLPEQSAYRSLPWPAAAGGNYGVNWDRYSPALYIANENDPVVQVRLPSASWGYPAGDYAVRIPRGVDGASGGDGELLVVDAGRIYNLWQFRRTSDTTGTAQSLAWTDVRSGSGWGARGGRSAGITAAGASQGAGLLTEFDDDVPEIDHALQLIVDVRHNVPTPVGEAIHADGWGHAGQPGVELHEGQRLAIPRSTRMPAGLSPLGQKVFRALQTYGGFDVDSSWGMTGLRVQSNAFDAATVGALGEDMKAIVPLLHAVD